MNDNKIQNATDVWQKEISFPSIPTFSQSLDNVLGNGGVKLGSITELLGLPGIGKTQLCLQLCASIQIPEKLGGLNAEALYIDTNTNFTALRFRDILNASMKKCCRILGTSADLSEDEGLDKLHYVNALGLEKFCAFMHKLPDFISRNSKIKLIIIDSIIFPFKEGISTKQRTGLLFRQMSELHRLVMEQQIAVVVTNEMSTRVGLGGGAVVGALGDAWAHRCNTRILLSNSKTQRLALLIKSNDVPSTVGQFQITHEGIRDVESNSNEHT